MRAKTRVVGMKRLIDDHIKKAGVATPYWGGVLRNINCNSNDRYNEYVAWVKEKTGKTLRFNLSPISDGPTTYSARFLYKRFFLSIPIPYNGTTQAESVYSHQIGVNNAFTHWGSRAVALVAVLNINNNPTRWSIGSTSDGLIDLQDTKHSVYGQHITYEYAGRAIRLPDFYQLPYNTIDDTYLAEIYAQAASRSKRRFIKGKVKGNGDFNLAIIAESKTNITIHLMSLASLYFLDDLILEATGLSKESLDEFRSLAPMRAIASRLLASRGTTRANLLSRVQELNSQLISTHREIYSLDNGTGLDEVQRIFARLKQDASKISNIIAIAVDHDGGFHIVCENLKLKLFHNSSGFLLPAKLTPDIKTDTVEYGCFVMDVQRPHLRRLVTGEALRHPHLYNDHICTGTGGSLHSELVGNFNIIGAYNLIMSLCEKYNPESPVNGIDGVDSSYHKDLLNMTKVPVDYPAIGNFLRSTAHVIYYKDKSQEAE